MTAPSNPAEFIDRLRAVNWSGSAHGRTRSRRLLMQEHLRRAAWWAQRFPSGKWPFPDLAEAVDPTVRADDTLVEEVEDLTAFASFVDGAAAVDALHWYALRAVPGVVLPDLPDPYEPLLVFFERGGGFTMISGYLDVDGSLVPRGDVADHLIETPVVDLDPTTLDEIDEA
ncbi:hypothetical protein [Catellatospora citrea]|uniref:Uncharacterized protein n=1 Tax=Catellatospora citrea TaxID=53366 RepID=A0A8J3KD67_9ACTN|nr:hypothetical protein [Catellatospora citrea]RKE08078.1 hypothetical protein C8E86_2921 [Catellatospora citrea]GIF98459.1 hypothetical protein Cci01nite_35530 [Catellatospora citrea]